jgi:hypothetical protein
MISERAGQPSLEWACSANPCHPDDDRLTEANPRGPKAGKSRCAMRRSRRR